MSDITKVKDLPATVTTAIEALRKFAKYLVIPTGVTTFFPDEWLQHMRLLSIKDSSTGTWISIAFWLSISIVVIDWLHIVSGKFAAIYKKWKFKKILAKNMDTLTDTEKDIVYKIFRNDNYYFDAVGDAAVKTLESLGVIFHANLGRAHSGFSFGLQPPAREFLMKNPEYFEKYIEEKTKQIEDEIEELRSSIAQNSIFDCGAQQKQAEIQRLQNILEEYK